MKLRICTICKLYKQSKPRGYRTFIINELSKMRINSTYIFINSLRRDISRSPCFSGPQITILKLCLVDKRWQFEKPVHVPPYPDLEAILSTQYSRASNLTTLRKLERVLQKKTQGQFADAIAPEYISENSPNINPGLQQTKNMETAYALAP